MSDGSARAITANSFVSDSGLEQQQQQQYTLCMRAEKDNGSGACIMFRRISTVVMILSGFIVKCKLVSAVCLRLALKCTCCFNLFQRLAWGKPFFAPASPFLYFSYFVVMYFSYSETYISLWPKVVSGWLSGAPVSTCFKG